MEVAGQWRREWAGTAEYGKVTEGGVTRRVARAMEVLHASAPGARVRVMRAAYHSSSGPGVPASSYMLHSSRRVISSGFNILESPTFPSKPLEISSTPLESSPEYNTDTENYKVTEPDDMDISEPSKWRGTTGGSSIRMPSEESSSTDNASIIDLDSRKGLYRKYSYDSENSDVHSLKRSSARASPLLDPPVTLSTLKYKSLLNNSHDWNNRRKSYSFEDTSPLNEIMVQKNDTLAMESSTDSGICKSSEIVNDDPEDTYNLKNFVGREKRFNNHKEDSADNWQYRNKPSTFHTGYRMKNNYKEHEIVLEEPADNIIALQSRGKVTITVPITIEGADDDKHKNVHSNDEGDRKTKRVEFCKTELHFAAESGRVNIIATDEKPPPTNDFRKRRSAFVPINDKFEKPITLFGDRNEILETQPDVYGVNAASEAMDNDENTAATKSILKNKIPKPKPYLLGENMAFGGINNVPDQSDQRSVPVGVSLINKELQTQRISRNTESVHSFSSIAQRGYTETQRTTTKGPANNDNLLTEKHPDEQFFLHTPTKTKANSDSIQHKLSALQMSPVPKPKTRQLRESDLTFFGIDNHHKKTSSNTKNVEQRTTRFKKDFVDDSFESVRLVKQISSSAQNSEAESDDLADYQNIPLKTNFAPVPIPRSRVKNKNSEDVTVLKPIIERDDTSKDATPRRARSRKQDEFVSMTNRSRSEPSKTHRRENTLHNYNKNGTDAERNTRCTDDKRRLDSKTINYGTSNTGDDMPLYANLGVKTNNREINSVGRTRNRDFNNVTKKSENIRILSETKKRSNKSSDIDSNSFEKKQSDTKKINRVYRTEKLVTPEIPNSIRKIRDHPDKVRSPNGTLNHSNRKKENRNTSSQGTNRDTESLDKKKGDCEIQEAKIILNDEDDLKKGNRQSSKDRIRKNDYSKSIKSADLNSTDYRNSSKETQKVKDSGERGTNSNTRRTSRRSEYVIKYDDKNGTISSISKVRAGHSKSRQKHTSKDRNKDNSKEMKTKSKNTEISALRNAAPRSSNSERKKQR